MNHQESLEVIKRLTQPEVIAALTRAVSRFDKFKASTARLEAEVQQLVAKHDGSLDDKTCQRFSTVNSGLAISKAAADVLRTELLMAYQSGTLTEQRMTAKIGSEQAEIEQAIADHVYKNASEDIRDSINIYGTKSYQTEVETRLTHTHWGVQGWTEATPDQLRDYCAGVVGTIETLEQELKRCAAAKAKYGWTPRKEEVAAPMTTPPALGVAVG